MKLVDLASCHFQQLFWRLAQQSSHTAAVTSWGEVFAVVDEFECLRHTKQKLSTSPHVIVCITTKTSVQVTAGFTKQTFLMTLINIHLNMHEAAIEQPRFNALCSRR